MDVDNNEPDIKFMKRIFTTLLTLALCTTSMLAQVIYSTSFKTEEEFNAWSVVNANDDDKTWQFNTEGDPSYLYYPYSSANAADDWMISPAITSKESGTLAISFKVKGSSYTEKIELFCGNAQNVEAMTTRVSEVLELNDNITSHIYIVDVEADKPFHLGFRACSDADKWRLYLCEVNVKFTTNPVDLLVSEITAPASDFGLSQENVTVKVKNNGNVDVTSFDVAFAVDNTVVSTEKVEQTLAKGEEMEYTFTAKADLNTPRKKFSIKAWTIEKDDINTYNDTCRIEVLHKAPATIPYFMGFESNEYTDGISIFNLNEDDGNWDVYSDPWWNLARTGDFCLAYNYNKHNDANDWAILEPIKIEEEGYYVLRFWYSGDDTHPEKLAVYYGNEAAPSAMTNLIVEYAPFARSAYEESINIIYLEKQENLHIGFRAFSDKDENWICIDDVSLEKISSETVDLALTNISAPTEYLHKGSKKDIKFTLRNLGISDTEAKINVKIDDNEIKVIEETIKAQAINEYTIDGALANIPAGNHTVTVEVTNADDIDTDNNSISHKFIIMGEPAVLWDFEDGKLPEEFTFRAEDSGTVNPSAGEEFNAEGWGIFNIQEHPLYGKHVLAGTSWLDGTDKADRWCILPEFRPSSDSHLVWDVASFNPHFLETYNVMISSNGDDNWYYFTEKEFISESADFKTRGISLESYSDASIYIAFRLRSKNCEHLIIDNIGLYGGALTGVEEVGEGAYYITAGEDWIEVKGEGVDSVEIYRSNGTLVSGTLSARGIESGVYVVKVTTDSGTYSQKVIVK